MENKMPRITAVKSLFMFFILTQLVECSDGGSNFNSALSADNINLIFVVSPDLAYSTSGDYNPETANLSDQGLQRSLRMAPFLKQWVLGGMNVNSIYSSYSTIYNHGRA
jgi:hypothetical protein